MKKTSYEVWNGKKPLMSFPKIWRCEALVKRQVYDNLAPKSEKCIFVEYPKETRGYYFCNHSENKVIVT